MREFKRAKSAISGREEIASICPELLSDDGQKFADGIADIDILDCFDLGFSLDQGILPIAFLDNGKKLSPQGQSHCLRRIGRNQRKYEKKMEVVRRKREARDEMLANVNGDWDRPLTEEEIQDSLNDGNFMAGILKLMTKGLTEEMNE